MPMSKAVLSASAVTMAAALGVVAFSAAADAPVAGPLRPIDEASVESLLQARVFTEDGASPAVVERVDFDDHGALERVWIRFQPAFSDEWTIRALASDVAYAPGSDAVVVNRSEDELLALSHADPEFGVMSATRVSVQRMPLSRLIGRTAIDETGASIGVVASVASDGSGRADVLRLSDGALARWRGEPAFDVPAHDAFYLPVTDRILVLAPEVETEGPLAAAQPRCIGPSGADQSCA